jgi:hypothetical protein
VVQTEREQWPPKPGGKVDVITVADSGMSSARSPVSVAVPVGTGADIPCRFCVNVYKTKADLVSNWLNDNV